MSTDFGAYARALGERVDAEWSRSARSLASFPDAAASALSSLPPDASTSPLDIVEWVVSGGVLPRQASLDLAFGQPPLTVFSNDAFRIDVLFWHQADIGIHQHQFAGAFTLLHGASVESRYFFELERQCGPALRVGRVVLSGIDTLERGVVRSIPLGADLIHSVFHLDTPTVTMVIRTHQDRAHGPEFEYKPPGVAIDPSAPNPSAVKTLQLLRLLSRTSADDYERAALRAIARADLHGVYRILEQARLYASPRSFERLAEAARRSGPEVDTFFIPSLEVEWRRRFMSGRRSAAHGHHRFLLALLTTLPDQRAVVAAMEQRHPGEEPLALVETWIGELSGDNWTGIEFDAPLLLIFRHLLRRASIDDVVAALASEYSLEEAEGQRADIAQAFESMTRSAVLAPLFA